MKWGPICLSVCVEPESEPVCFLNIASNGQASQGMCCFIPGKTSTGENDEDIDGDNIFVGDDTNLEIVSVDLISETITVNRSITWTDEEDVSLSSYYGLAPDIGAYEYPSSGHELHEFGEKDQFRLFCLVIFCFVVMTRKLYIKQVRKLIMLG